MDRCPVQKQEDEWTDALVRSWRMNGQMLCSESRGRKQQMIEGRR